MAVKPVWGGYRRTLRAMSVLAAASTVATACALASGSAGAATSSGKKSPVDIAVIVGSSGVDALNGQQVNAGVKAAAAVLNSQGGVDGHKINISYDDDRSDPATAVQDLRSAASSGIHFVVGATTDPSCVAMQPIAEELGVTMVTPTCEDNALTSPHPTSTYFQVAPTDTGLAVGTAKLTRLAYPKITRWVTSNPDFSFGHTFYPQFEKTMSSIAKGSSFSTPQYIPLSATSFTSYVNQIQSDASPKSGLMSSTFGETLIGFIKTGLSLGLFSHFAGYSASAVANPTLSALGSSVPNMWFSYTYYYSIFNNAANSVFIRKFKSQNSGAYPSAWNEMAYTAVQSIAAGIRKAHSTNATTVAKAMQGLKVNSPEGTITINAKTHLFEQYMINIHVEPTSTGYTVVKSLTIPFSNYGQ